MRFFQVFENLGVLVMIVVVVALVSTVTPGFLQPGNVSSLLVTAAILAVPALGMTLAIAMGALDLSIGSLQALTACTVASLLTVIGLPLSASPPRCCWASSVGLINGLLVTRLHVPAFVATLGMMSVLRGAALLATDGQSILLMGQDELAEHQLGPAARRAHPHPHRPGRLRRALAGHAPDALRAARLRHRRQREGRPRHRPPVDRVKVVVFMIVGVTAAMSGVMLTAQLLLVNGTMGVGLELRAIAVVVLGGTSLMGGNANLLGHAPGRRAAGRHQQRPEHPQGASPSTSTWRSGLLLILALALDTLRRAVIRRAVSEGRL